MYSEQEKRFNWMNKKTLAGRAKEHTEQMALLFRDEIEDCVAHTKEYDNARVKQQLLNTVSNGRSKITVTDEDTVSALFRLKEEDVKDTGGKSKIAVVNFASFRNPGGMFIEGSRAQEECLCHSSFLFNVLSRKQEFYDTNIERYVNNNLYVNRGLYTENVRFFSDNGTYRADVITCAAPNWTAAQKRRIPPQDNSKALLERIKFVLYLAQLNDVKILVFGAFGCGVFGQDASEVAQDLLYINYKHFFGLNQIVCAIPNTGNENHNKFKEILQKD